MGCKISFVYQTWAAMFPQLACNVSPAQAQGYFEIATLFQRNDGGGPVCDCATQTALLNLLTAHIATLYAIQNGQAPSGLVGRIGNATEGSVSVGTVYMTPTGDIQAWADQTQPGATWYAATAQFRTFQYRALPRQNLTPGFPGYPGLSGGWYGWRQ